MYVLGVETSCDETSCSIVKDGYVLSNSTISSLKQHVPFGGVVPEVATRAHLKNIDKVLNAALQHAKIPLKRIDLIAVTHEPGLIGALVVGLTFAKTLALALNKPLIGINHLHAHMFAPFLNRPKDIKFPFLGVVISGGHTDFYLVQGFDKIRLVGATQDDACGEAYDKLARAFGLGYPGGPVIDKMFDEQYKDDFKFNCGRRDFDLSFSGIKTALVYKKQEFERAGKFDKDVCCRLLSSFQHTAANAIVGVAVDAAKKYKVQTIAAGGGVIANRYLREQLLKRAEGIEVFLPAMPYAMDNAAMVAGLGFYLYNKAGKVSKINLQARAS